MVKWDSVTAYVFSRDIYIFFLCMMYYALCRRKKFEVELDDVDLFHVYYQSLFNYFFPFTVVDQIENTFIH